MNPKTKRCAIGVTFVGMVLVAGVLAFSLSSHLQSADAKKDAEKDKYEKLRESIRKEVEVVVGTSDRGNVVIFGGNSNRSQAIGIDGADAIGIGIDETDGTSNATGADGTDGIRGTDGSLLVLKALME